MFRSLHLSTKQATQSENNIQNINVREYRRGNQKDNPEKPATQGTQDEEKQSKNTTHVLATTIPKHTRSKEEPNIVFTETTLTELEKCY